MMYTMTNGTDTIRVTADAVHDAIGDGFWIVKDNPVTYQVYNYKLPTYLKPTKGIQK